MAHSPRCALSLRFSFRGAHRHSMPQVVCIQYFTVKNATAVCASSEVRGWGTSRLRCGRPPAIPCFVNSRTQQTATIVPIARNPFGFYRRPGPRDAYISVCPMRYPKRLSESRRSGILPFRKSGGTPLLRMRFRIGSKCAPLAIALGRTRFARPDPHPRRSMAVWLLRRPKLVGPHVFPSNFAQSATFAGSIFSLTLISV